MPSPGFSLGRAPAAPTKSTGGAHEVTGGAHSSRGRRPLERGRLPFEPDFDDICALARRVRPARCTSGRCVPATKRSPMPAAAPLKNPVPVGQLVRRRLRELKRTSRELAEAVKVTESYIAELVAGRRRPPAPGSDLYAPMGKFLQLHRNDLPTCAR